MREDEATELGWDDSISSEDVAEHKANQIIDALISYLKVRNEYDKANASYEGYEWGYHGHYEIEREKKAREVLRNAILDIV